MSDTTPPPYVPEPTPYAAPVAAGKTNTLAIVSLVTSLVGIGLAGVITGHISLGQIKRTGESGRGLALAGTIIGYVGIVAVIIFTIIWISFFAYAASNGYTTYDY